MTIAKRRSSGFQNDAAEKIWNDHVGNNAFVRHRDQCAVCLAVYQTREALRSVTWCPEGERVFDQMLDEVLAEVDEAIATGN